MNLELSFLKPKLWRLFSLYVRKRDFYAYYGRCVSCGTSPGFQLLQAGHFHEGSTSWNGLYFHEKNVNAQCSDCNMFGAGNKEGYEKGLIDRYGPDVLVELEDAKRDHSVWCAADYLERIEKYQKLVRVMA